MKKIICVAILLLMVITIGGCHLDEEEKSEKNRTKTDVIYEEIDKIIEPYLDENGYIEHDENIIKESSEKVYEYAKELKKKGKIEECTYCEESNVVAFFYKDNNTSLYIPKIKETYAGDTNGFYVTSVETLPTLDKAVIDSVDQFSRFRITGAAESAKLIDDNYEEYISHKKITNKTWKTLDDVAEWMGDLSKNNTRVILWRGHGSVFETPNGELLAVWCLPIKRDKSNDKYIDGEYSLLVSGDYCAISSNFWKNYCDNVNDGLFFTVSCNTGRDNGYAAKIFFEKGFSTYAAPNGSIWTTYADKMMGRTIEYMCGEVDNNQYNFDEAIAKAREDINETDVYGVTIVHGNVNPNKPFELIPKTEEELFHEYFKTLINKYGLMNPVQNGTMTDWEDEWLEPEGIMSGGIYDLDGDDQKEALVLRVTGDKKDDGYYVLEMEVYEIEDNKVVLSSSMTMDEISWRKNNYGRTELHVSLIEKDEEIYIFYEKERIVKCFADGETRSYRAIKYDKQLEDVIAFVQTAGGSCDFEYTGYEYKDGQVIYDELLCSEVPYGEVGTYDNYKTAISEWFKRYGINIADNSQDGYNLGESILSNENRIIPIADYLADCVDCDYRNNIHKMQALLTDNTKIRDIQ